MDHKLFLAAASDLVYLSACAVNGAIPDAGRVSAMDLDAVYDVAERHMLSAVAAMALESAGRGDARSSAAIRKAMRRTACFEAEKAGVLQKLEEAGIWHMPLKGSVLKDLYPKISMRQMTDIDILIDPDRSEDVRHIMEELGFVHDHGGTRIDDYRKEPVCSFEMHRTLFTARKDGPLRDYYRDVGSRLLPDEGSRFGRHFSDEDFYLYMVAHEYHHYVNGGTGLRSLLDTYVYLTRKGDRLDRDAIDRELGKLGLRDFEAQMRGLALSLFCGEPLSDGDREMLEYILDSGTFGTMENAVRYRVKAMGGGPSARLRYVFRRVFLPMEDVRSNYPFFYRHRVLLPALLVYRVGLALTSRRRKVLREISVLQENEPLEKEAAPKKNQNDGFDSE